MNQLPEKLDGAAFAAERQEAVTMTAKRRGMTFMCAVVDPGFDKFKTSVCAQAGMRAAYPIKASKAMKAQKRVGLVLP